MSQAQSKSMDNTHGKAIVAPLPGVCMHFLKTKAIQAQFVETVKDWATLCHPPPPWWWEQRMNGIHCLMLISSCLSTYMLTALQLARRVMGGTACSCPARAHGRKCVHCLPDWQCSSIPAILNRSFITSCPFLTRSILAQLAAQACMLLKLDVCVYVCVCVNSSAVLARTQESALELLTSRLC